MRVRPGSGDDDRHSDEFSRGACFPDESGLFGFRIYRSPKMQEQKLNSHKRQRKDLLLGALLFLVLLQL
jgi:hypothetical protein